MVKRGVRLLCVILLAGALLALSSGCGNSRPSEPETVAGATGASGATGPTGPAGPVDTTTPAPSPPPITGPEPEPPAPTTTTTPADPCGGPALNGFYCTTVPGNTTPIYPETGPYEPETP